MNDVVYPSLCSYMAIVFFILVVAYTSQLLDSGPDKERRIGSGRVVDDGLGSAGHSLA